MYDLGHVVTCSTDSTSFFGHDTIVVSYRHYGENKKCPNLPKMDNWSIDGSWPASMYFDIKKHEFNFRCDYKYHEEENGGENYLVTTAKYFYGSWTYSKKKELITLTAKDFKWTRTFKFEFDKLDSRLTLIKNN
mgnify:CR=1 FL=1